MVKWLKRLLHERCNWNPSNPIHKVDILLSGPINVYAKDIGLIIHTNSVIDSLALLKRINTVDYNNDYVFNSKYRLPIINHIYLSVWYSVDGRVIDSVTFIHWLKEFKLAYKIYIHGLTKASTSRASRNSVKISPYINNCISIIDTVLR